MDISEFRRAFRLCTNAIVFSKTKYHTSEFYNVIYSIMDKDKVRKVENKILNELLKINDIRLKV